MAVILSCEGLRKIELAYAVFTRAEVRIKTRKSRQMLEILLSNAHQRKMSRKSILISFQSITVQTEGEGDSGDPYFYSRTLLRGDALFTSVSGPIK